MASSSCSPSRGGLPEWQVLSEHARTSGHLPLRELFAADHRRAERLSFEACGLFVDHSKQRLTDGTLPLLVQLARASGLRERIDAMFAGARINATENRAVLHVALRAPRGARIVLDGENVVPGVHEVLDRMAAFCDRVRNGQWLGHTGKRIRTIVNIGIGGSDLGPVMAYTALRHYADRELGFRFVSNVDGTDFAEAVHGLDPAETLFIVSSKTFTTQETLANARTARAWLVGHLGEAAVPSHFAAVSVNAAAMDAFGIHPERRFKMWDWVGGRYSLWSSVGVSLAIAIGAERFEQLLAGAHAMDQHFREAPWSRNLPVLMALIGIWNIDCERLPTLAVLPYDSRLARFPAFLQQLDMESYGKRVCLDGLPVSHGTGPVVWGEPGNDAQHSFFQMLHQGTPRAALDILVGMRSSCGREDHQELAIANALAQSEAFLRGRGGEGVTPHQVHEGGRPVSLLLFDRLDPSTLGALVALYEHKVFVQSVVWGINAFDQFGVELGKRIANEVLDLMRAADGMDAASSSLRSVLAHVRARRGGDR